MDQKKKYLEDKERHSLEVRKQMEVREFSRIDYIKKKREEKDSVLSKTQSERDWSLMLKREMDLIKREEKLENVERIAKAQEYKKAKVLEKIEFGNLKTEHVKKEREKLLDTRFQVRREADKQKQTIMDAFETMKKKGKIDNTHLVKLGLDIQIKEDPNREQEVDIDAVKERQTKELKNLLDSEKRAEEDRLQKINATTDEAQKQKLMKENDQAKALSSDKIAKMQSNHQHELNILS
jgi:hypothetical protein